MVREIVRDTFFLSQRSQPATAEDAHIGADLIDTLLANRERCVGMAANMIGELCRVIVLFDGDKPLVMFNPEIVSRKGEYQTEEGCLSLDGQRPANRFKSIKVSWRNERFQPRVRNFSDFTAQIIQHELDHCDGIII